MRQWIKPEEQKILPLGKTNFNGQTEGKKKKKELTTTTKLESNEETEIFAQKR